MEERFLYKAEPRGYNRRAVHAPRSPLLPPLLVVLLLCVAGCSRGSSGATPSPADTAGDAQRQAADTGPKVALPAVPGLSLDTLPAAIQRELAQVLSDEFCHCGCPHTIGACLKEHDCTHARRMTALAVHELKAGASAVEVINALARYYKSFRDPRATLTVDGRMCTGAGEDAAVTLVEYSDFECPYCAAARPLLEEFTKKRKDVRLCFAPFPLDGHPNAMPAAQAALAARDVGKFWPMHDALFLNQTELSQAKIRELGQTLGIGAAVAKALEQKPYTEELQRSKAQGKAAGVDATPALFINGRKFTLPLSEEGLAHTVDDELEWRANGGGWAKD